MTPDSSKKFLVVTDLDASLLDHDYGYEGAKEALSLLKEKGYPLVLNSSKTYAELRELAAELGQCDAVVAENGGLVGIHEGASIARGGVVDAHGFELKPAGMHRSEILEIAHGLREERGYAFEGFADWTVEQVMHRTGLGYAAAEKAMERETTEPILWDGSSEEWDAFLGVLREKGIKALRGGRFIHLMGEVDKVQGMLAVSALYKEVEPETEWTVVAVGDSANDKAMLEAADVAVVIPHADGARVQPEHATMILAPHPGSRGWGEAILNLIQD